jgi:hypothetical protein
MFTFGKGIHSNIISISQVLFTTIGSQSWQVPSGVTSICICCISGGTGGQGGYYVDDSNSWGGAGGIGGTLVYSNSISVTSGETLTIYVGAGGSGGVVDGGFGNTGVNSYVSRASTPLIKAITNDFTNSIGTSKSLGGIGGSDYFVGGGGGSCGGYTNNISGAIGGADFDGLGGPGINGSGSGGNSGDYVIDDPYIYYGDGGHGGGGTGIKGQGTNGTGDGGGGSGGTNGTIYEVNLGEGGKGGNYGGGGGGGGWIHDNQGNGLYRAYIGGSGGQGAVRIIWGSGRSYPNNATDV